MLIIGGGARSIGLYAAGLAVAHGAAVVHYVDDDPVRRRIAEAFGAPGFTRAPRRLRYDVVVEASSRAAGLRRAIRVARQRRRLHRASGTTWPPARGCRSCTCTPPTRRSASVSHARAVLPDVLDFVARTRYPAEQVTTLTADWEDAPTAYAARTTKLVLQRDALSDGPGT